MTGMASIIIGIVFLVLAYPNGFCEYEKMTDFKKADSEQRKSYQKSSKQGKLHQKKSELMEKEYAPLKRTKLTMQALVPPMEKNDPLFSRQWYLYNQKNPGHDINVLPVWREGVYGAGVVVALIDDGIDYKHKDLSGSFRKDLSYDFNTGTNLPIPDPKLRDHHGTRCAGQIVSQHDNYICGVGIAPKAQISAIRILSAAVSSRNEAAAVVYRYHENHIYSCSWGPADDGKAIDGPDSSVLKAFIDGLVRGRDGKGSIYVFAAGNGKLVDNCNYDGYANGIFALTVGAIDYDHKMPPYMEPCSAQLISSYSSNEHYKIATTDLGKDRCTLRHGGTSAAAPMVTGILALVLSIRPELTWRDIRYLCVETAIPINVNDSSWVKNGAGRYYSFKFGFGKIDAHQIVAAARQWKQVGRQTVRSLPERVLNKRFDSDNNIIDQIDINNSISKRFKLNDIDVIEYVTITFSMEHSCRGDISIQIESPAGTLMDIATRRPLDKSQKGLKGISMMTAGFWGERGIGGVWKIIFKNAPGADSHGILLDYRLSFFGLLNSRVGEDDEKYATMFLHNYYPPTKDHFANKDNIWEPKKSKRLPPPISRGIFLGGGLVILILLSLIFLLIALRQRAKKLTFERISTDSRSSDDVYITLDNLPSTLNKL